uniref:UDP-N-acetylmuramate dehydrogenase n=2 Tax=Cannabis sativa TaxID=3483 RepID=A0A803Q5I9_CANSA
MAGILVCHCHGHGPTLLLPNSPQKTRHSYMQLLIAQNLTFVRGQKLLKDLSTWGIGGPCNYFTQVFHPTQLLSAIRYCHDHRLRFMIIGKGSNCLFDDLGFDGCVILNRMEWMEVKGVGVYKVGSGYRFNRLGMQCSNEGFTGLEFAAGIPGTVGGAAYMNAGANGQETANVVESIDVVTIDGKLQRFERADLMFGYRSSPFQRMPNLAAIVAVTFRLQSSTISRTKLQQYLERRASQPIGERSAGSVFRNPSDLGIGAGELIEKAGLKGFRVGGAMISKLHANFFINANGSTSQDMLDLIAVAKDKVYQKFGVELKEEVLYVNPSKLLHNNKLVV